MKAFFELSPRHLDEVVLMMLEVPLACGQECHVPMLRGTGVRLCRKEHNRFAFDLFSGLIA